MPEPPLVPLPVVAQFQRDTPQLSRVGEWARKLARNPELSPSQPPAIQDGLGKTEAQEVGPVTAQPDLVRP
jgi:hypothetical protein